MKEFTIALNTVIENFVYQPNYLSTPNYSESELKILKYWSINSKDQSISPQLAYKLWLEAQNSDCKFVANLLRKQDRMAAGRYILTGELLGGTTGSVVMFANPATTPLSLNHNFLATIEFTNLVREWKKPEVSDIV